ncbi:MAG: winged helix-turn-helix domain-containing protein [Candidatus Nanohaloarchaea archaeon]
MEDGSSYSRTRPSDIIISKGVSPEKASRIANKISGSELATKILFNLYSHEENYTSQIARDLDKSQTSIDRLVRKLRDAGIIKVSKKGRSVFYELSYEGAARFVINSIGYRYAEKQVIKVNNSEIDLTDLSFFRVKTFLEKHLKSYFEFIQNQEYREYNLPPAQTTLGDVISVDEDRDKNDKEIFDTGKELGTLFFDDFFFIFKKKMIQDEIPMIMRKKLLSDLLIMYEDVNNSLFAEYSLDKFESSDFMGLTAKDRQAITDFEEKLKSGLRDIPKEDPVTIYQNFIEERENLNEGTMIELEKLKDEYMRKWSEEVSTGRSKKKEK